MKNFIICYYISILFKLTSCQTNIISIIINMIKSPSLIILVSLLICGSLAALGNAEADYVDPVDLGLNFTPDFFFAGYLKSSS